MNRGKKDEQPKPPLLRMPPRRRERQDDAEGIRTPAGRAQRISSRSPHRSDTASQSELRETSVREFSPKGPKLGREDRRPTNGSLALPRVKLREVVGSSATRGFPLRAQEESERPRESTDPPKTRTWNLRLRRPTPHSLGQRAP
jgi:hypothetical protein